MLKLRDLILGVVLFGASCFAGVIIATGLTVMTFGVGAGLGTLISFALPLLTAGILIIYAGSRGKSGYALAPLVFMAGWFVVSVAVRGYWTSEAARFEPSKIDPALSNIRTLVVDDFLKFSRSFLTEGVVDRLVEVTYEDNDRRRPINSIKQTVLASGKDCTAADDSFALRAAGRLDECLKVSQLKTVPDGVHILYPPYKTGPKEWPQTMTASIVKGGVKVEEITWRRFRVLVPSYLPFFFLNSGLSDRTQTIWEMRFAPVEYVSFGDLDLTSQAMAAAIYRFTPIDNPKPKLTDLAKVAKRAESAGASGDFQLARAMVALLIDANFIDDATVKASAYTMLAPSDLGATGHSFSFYALLPKFTAAQRTVFADQVLRILTTPRICYCRLQYFFWDQSPLEKPALKAFQNVSGLEAWQYGGLLTAANFTAAPYWRSPFSPQRQAVLNSLMETADLSTGNRIAGFIEFAEGKLLDTEMRAFTTALAALNDDGIATLSSRYIVSPEEIRRSIKGGSLPPDAYVESRTWQAYWSTLQIRASAIKDDAARSQALERIMKNLNKA